MMREARERHEASCGHHALAVTLRAVVDAVSESFPAIFWHHIWAYSQIRRQVSPPNPAYLRELLEYAGLSQREAARHLRTSDRMMRMYLA